MTLISFAAGDVTKSEGEAFLYNIGSVGIFGEIGSPEACIRPNNWNRLVITLGASLAKQSAPTTSSSMTYGRSMLGQTAPRNSRALTTYVNSRKCTTVSADRRGVLGTSDGRFALRSSGFIVFGSSNLACMGSPRLIKFLELRPVCCTEDQVKQNHNENRVYSLWEKQRAADMAQLQSQLTLRPIVKNPPPVWVHPVVCGEFGEPFIQGTGLEGGSFQLSSSFYELMIKLMLYDMTDSSETSPPPPPEGKDSSDMEVDGVDNPAALVIASSTPERKSDTMHQILQEYQFTHQERQSLNYVYQLLRTLKYLCSQHELAKKNGPTQILHYIKILKKHLERLQIGETLLVPGGVDDSAMLYVVECEEENSYRFSIVNTNINAGLDFHPSSVVETPFSSLLGFQCVVSITNVTTAKILDDAFWGLLLKLMFYASKKNTPDKIYNLLLPYLVDKPLEFLLKESEQAKWSGTDCRMPQRANISYVTCIHEMVRYVFLRRNVTLQRANDILLCLKTKILVSVKNDLQLVNELGSHEKTVIELCLSELAREFTKNCNDINDDTSDNGPSANQLQCVHLLLSDIGDRTKNLRLPIAEQMSHTQTPIEFLEPIHENASMFPLFDRLKRTDDVNGLAGPPVVMPKYVPINFLMIPVAVRDLDDVIATIRDRKSVV